MWLQTVLVLATGPGKLPAVRVWTRKFILLASRTVQKSYALHQGRPNPAPYKLTDGFCLIALDPSVTISGTAFGVFYLLSHSDILLLIVEDRCLYIRVIFELNGSL
jgi:hypothetical protein